MSSSQVAPTTPGRRRGGGAKDATGSVLAKLVSFSIAMIVVPISSYFLSVDRFFDGNTTYAGALAAALANVVLVSYVVVALLEDDGSKEGKDGDAGAGAEGKKDE